MEKIKVLAPLKKSKSVPNIIAFDTEDNGKGAPNNFLCACFYDGNRHRVFLDRAAARKFIFDTQRHGATIFFAHNLAYDLANLDYPEGTAKLIPIATRLIGAKFRARNRGAVQFMDTGNFFVGASIEKLGEKLDYPKIKFDINKIKNKQLSDLDDDTIKELTTYCSRDAEICYKIACQLVTLTHNNHTAFKAFTAPALSMRIFRTNFLNDTLICRPQNINDFERLAYYGGRTEVFDYRHYPLIDYEDITSSYPTAMFYKEFPYPCNFSRVQNAKWSGIKKHEGVSLVRVTVPPMHIPPLPYRRKDDGRLIFPIGTWSGVYTHIELRMAEKYGVVIEEVIDSIIYHKTYNPFKGYVQEFYNKKNITKGIERDFYKLMLNGLSGKFGEKRTAVIRAKLSELRLCDCTAPEMTIYHTCKNCRNLIIEGTQPLDPDNNGWISIMGDKLPDPKHTFPILIAYICAYGRIKLYEERLSKCNALYCDTDSCITDKSPMTNIGKELGNWSLNKYEDFMAIAPKFYTYKYTDDKDGVHKEMLKLKGVPHRHLIIYSCDKCHTLNETRVCERCHKKLTDDNKRYKFERPLKLAEAIRRKLAPNMWIAVCKQISITDNKRIKHADGTSSPIEVHEDETYTKFSDLIDADTLDANSE